jgi:hypothetical protein
MPDPMIASHPKRPPRHSVPLTLCLDCGCVTDQADPPGWVSAPAPLLMPPHRYGLCPACLSADDVAPHAVRHESAA